jgi:hypothetical protein
MFLAVLYFNPRLRAFERHNIIIFDAVPDLGDGASF